MQKRGFSYVFDFPCPFCQNYTLVVDPGGILNLKYPRGWEGIKIPTSCHHQTCSLSGYRTLTNEQVEYLKQEGFTIP